MKFCAVRPMPVPTALPLDRLFDRADSAFTADVLAAASMAALRVARTYWMEHPHLRLRTLLANALQHVRE